ncbi:adenosylcobinamide kinase/adenosylcobinamide phosphate guanyltransferase [Bradyrhizobium sp. SSBR45G]|uniref:bifunctional adenosylcobinamide kinase/adenosylcobinamide-phosphate guanylyltransferase n=1 Tax=unclassified Bradyrhizobium TaxID=2631580 RepID=UPI00234290C8|nr:MULTISPECIES: bifunctional adenosylcobinamide kinase/adenosylcobinamide-phosphate guanylyltransferase [unclassified Bradyrhizobium]GLH79364.1 adenosylcobinamide kinase/adenosylcobinamide phosphate guanyltransferase [Bradyrhizobium sp. SSBR45G]GLH86700.1 adenosylcobinamide kinase/adenosylcobinamide phosphate guanyltransferase [Bradyrhizobium sp. SSBR45R]
MTAAPGHPALPRLTLVLGGARSGKSRHAEALVTAEAPPWIYIATAQAFDDEMTERIAHHKARRAAGWQTLETTHDLAAVVRQHAGSPAPLLIDCLTLWLSNVMLAEMNVAAACAELVDALTSARGPIVAVSNEVGLGIVPDNALARAFRDAQGRLNQDVAALADRVILMAAGLPLTLK